MNIIASSENMDSLAESAPRRSMIPEWAIPALVVAIDILLIGGGGIGAFFGYYLPVHGAGPIGGEYASALLVGMILFTQVFQCQHGYELAQLGCLSWQLRRTAASWSLALLLLLAFLFLLRGSAWLSRGWVSVWFAVTLVGLCAWRVGLHRVLVWCRLHGLVGQRAALVGSREEVEALLQHLQGGRGKDGLWLMPHIIEGLDSTDVASFIGGLDVIKTKIRSQRPDLVLVAHQTVTSGRLPALFDELRDLPAEVWWCPLPTWIPPSRGWVTFGEVSALRIWDRPINKWSSLVKWIEDQMLAVGALLLLSPLMMLISILIKIDTPGPVIFGQLRFGFNNEPFKCFKFRTMHTLMEDRSGQRRTVRDDPRITRVGRYLRRTSLDELPQLINVLRGEMSVVGPRAHPTHMKVEERYYYEAVKSYFSRHRVNPGVTGWAQVNGLRGEVDSMIKARRRVEHDLFYIDNWSLWLDFKILFLTITTSLFGKQVY